MDYVNYFLRYKCAPDVLSLVKIDKNPCKEITEAVAVQKRVKDIVLAASNQKDYIHVDFCSGNALAPILTAFTLKINNSVAIDLHRHKQDYHSIKNFEYLELDIYKMEDVHFKGKLPIIITGVHTCSNLAKRVIEIYNSISGREKHLILMPCCIGKYERTLDPFIQDKISSEDSWVYYLKNLVQGKAKAKRDLNIISPRNYIITANNKDERINN